MFFFKLIFLMVATLISLMITSCYPMPKEDEYSLIPVTNNPSITFEKPNATPGIPGASY